MLQNVFVIYLSLSISPPHSEWERNDDRFGMELLVVAVARLAMCTLSDKNEATVIKTRPRWGTPKMVQKYFIE